MPPPPKKKKLNNFLKKRRSKPPALLPTSSISKASLCPSVKRPVLKHSAGLWWENANSRNRSSHPQHRQVTGRQWCRSWVSVRWCRGGTRRWGEETSAVDSGKTCSHASSNHLPSVLFYLFTVDPSLFFLSSSLFQPPGQQNYFTWVMQFYYSSLLTALEIPTHTHTHTWKNTAPKRATQIFSQHRKPLAHTWVNSCFPSVNSHSNFKRQTTEHKPGLMLR